MLNTALLIAALSIWLHLGAKSRSPAVAPIVGSCYMIKNVMDVDDSTTCVTTTQEFCEHMGANPAPFHEAIHWAWKNGTTCPRVAPIPIPSEVDEQLVKRECLRARDEWWRDGDKYRDVDKIWPRVYIGNICVAGDVARMKALGITHVVAAARECGPLYPSEFTYFEAVSTMDDQDDDVDFEDAQRAAQFIMETLSRDRGATVLVHCSSRISLDYSSAVVLTYLTMYYPSHSTHTELHILSRGRMDIWHTYNQFCQTHFDTYKPDFILGNDIAIEIKGWLRPEDRTKLVAVKQQWPGLDLRIVFLRGTDKIKESKSGMTFGQWATKNGFKWAESTIPKSWIDE